GAIAAKAPRVATALTGREGADTGKGAGARGTIIAGRETRDKRKTAGDEAARHDRRKKTVARTVAREDAAAQRKGLADERLTQRRAKGHSFFESDELWTDARIGRKDQSTRLPRLSRRATRARDDPRQPGRRENRRAQNHAPQHRRAVRSLPTAESSKRARHDGRRNAGPGAAFHHPRASASAA